MKYKVLLTGTNQTLINDFFYHMEFSFECMYSSARAADIFCHLKYYRPDALIFCLYRENKDDVSAFVEVTRKLTLQNIPLIIVGEEENCELFEKTLPGMAQLVVKRPIATKKLEERIVAYFNEFFPEKKEEWESGAQAEPEHVDVSEIDKKIASKLQDISALINPPTEEPAEKKHILIVDDDSGVLKLVKNYLGGEYNVATAISGKVALRFLEKKKTDLILLDYEMPVESGAQVLQKIRSNEQTKNLPVIFLTGVTERERIQEVLELKPQGYLLKPINTERLSATLKEVLKG